jgi:hypothetical protein
MKAAASAAFLLAACGSTATGDGTAAPGNRIDCQPEGEAQFARVCTVEAFDSEEGRLLTIRKPDGGFRRLREIANGGVAAADGAERTRLTIRPDGEIEVEIGGDRFRLPAPVRVR